VDYRTLGPTGLTVSEICLGTWRFGRERDGQIEITAEQAHELLDIAWEYGLNFIDTANAYGTPQGRSEEIIGEWLADKDREEFVIASKVYHATRGVRMPSLSRKTIRAEIDDSLDRLGTDYLDICYLHRWDQKTPIRETLSTLNELVDAGKIHYLGASTMAAWRLTKGLWTSDVNGWEPITVTQPPLDAAYRTHAYPVDIDAYLDVCADQHLAVCPYSPLAGGLLTGKYSPDVDRPEGSRGSDEAEFFDEMYVSEQTWEVVEAVEEVAADLDATPSQVAIRWVMDQDRFTSVPIIGARTPDQLRENLGAVDISLSRDQFQRIVEARNVAGEG